MNNVEARARYVQALLEKVREDHFPSTTQLDLIEAVILPPWIPEYLDVLYEKVAEDTYPSVSMLNRIARMTEAVPA